MFVPTSLIGCSAEHFSLSNAKKPKLINLEIDFFDSSINLKKCTLSLLLYFSDIKGGKDDLLFLVGI